jgi:hypothetical protein
MNSDRLDFRSNKTNILIGRSLLEMNASEDNPNSPMLQQIARIVYVRTTTMMMEERML